MRAAADADDDDYVNKNDRLCWNSGRAAAIARVCYTIMASM